MYTEEEARRLKTNCKHEYCIASDCIMWKWGEAPIESKIMAIKRHRGENGSSLKDANNYVSEHPEYWNHKSDVGSCGLSR